ESPSLDVMGLLHQTGARLSYSDPHVPALAGRAWPGGYDLRSTPLDVATLGIVDCVAILTDHRSFDFEALGENGDAVNDDTRNAIKRPHPHVFKLGAPHAVHAEVWQPL